MGRLGVPTLGLEGMASVVVLAQLAPFRQEARPSCARKSPMGTLTVVVVVVVPTRVL